MNVRAAIAYAGRGIARPRYHANDSSGDLLDIARIDMDIADARARGATLDEAGFTLVAHRSAVTEFGDREAVNAVYRQEIVDLIHELSGADLVVVGSPGSIEMRAIALWFD
jgi:nucleotide-binding universal stress UspA family protein